ncbi:MAG: HypC/HybG/HupF family hydrogenase formation chaperone [Bacillota bacterium]|nr:MAG: HypC/HybG/HupF family hydrogenase formation chaperone [Bacillota bacterium]
MCLAVPARIVALDGSHCVLDLAGNRLRANVSLVDAPQVGDWVIVHAGYVLERIDQQAATDSLALAREIAGLSSGPSPSLATGNDE